MKKLIRTTLVVLLGAAGSITLLHNVLPDATPDQVPSTLTAYLDQPTETPLPAASISGTAVPAAVAGRVCEVYFSAGQRVRKGQVLVKVVEKIRTPEHHRLQLLAAHHQQAAEALAAQHPTDPDAVAAAQARAAATRQQLQQLPPQLSFLFVTAPQDGVVATRTVGPGDYLTVGTSVAVLAPLPTDDTTLLLSSAY